MALRAAVGKKQVPLVLLLALVVTVVRTFLVSNGGAGGTGGGELEFSPLKRAYGSRGEAAGHDDAGPEENAGGVGAATALDASAFGVNFSMEKLNSMLGACCVKSGDGVCASCASASNTLTSPTTHTQNPSTPEHQRRAKVRREEADKLKALRDEAREERAKRLREQDPLAMHNLGNTFGELGSGDGDGDGGDGGDGDDGDESPSRSHSRDPSDHWVSNLRPKDLSVALHLDARDVARERNRTKVLNDLESGAAASYMSKHDISVALNDQRRIQNGHDLISFKLRDHRGGARSIDVEAEFMELLPVKDMLVQRRDRIIQRLELDADAKPSVFRTCAIVGNSGTILGTRSGAAIDANEIVIRINYAPTKGYEADVGSKTSYDLLNKENTMKLATGEHRWRWMQGKQDAASTSAHARPTSELLLFEMHSRIIRQQVYLRLLKRRDVKGGHGPKMWFLSPALVSASRSVWYEVKDEVERDIAILRRDMTRFDGEMSDLVTPKNPAYARWQAQNYSSLILDIARRQTERDAARRAANVDDDEHPKVFRFNNKPMSGVVALYFALQFCQTTTLYGFDAFKSNAAAALAARKGKKPLGGASANPNRVRAKYHYFDDREGMTDVHSFDYAMEWFNRIGQHMDVRVARMDVPGGGAGGD